MPGKKRESKAGNGQLGAVSILSEGIETRIRAVVEAFDTRTSAASAAQVSTDMLYRYMRGSSPPSFAAMAGLCRTSGHSLDWLAFGEGAPMAGGVAEAPTAYGANPANLDLLERVVRALRTELQRRRITLDPAKEARAVRLLYKIYADRADPPTSETVAEVLDLAAYR